MKPCKFLFVCLFTLAGAAVGTAVEVTFQVDLAYQITNDYPTFVPGSDTVEVKGSFNDWSDGVALENVQGTTLYTNTYDVTGFDPDSIIQYKFHTYGVSGDIWDGYPGYVYTNGGNRAFVLAGSAQTLPPVYFSDQWGGQVPLTFQVDMGPQISVGNFVPGVDTVEVRGSWDGFSSGMALVNTPIGDNANIYATTFNVVGSPAPGGLVAYKFHIYGGPDYYEADPNRVMLVSSPATTLPLVYFSDLATNDMLSQDTLVIFSINLTNAVSAVDGHTFDPESDSVYINGQFANSYGQIGTWYPWTYWWTYNPAPPGYQMIKQGTSLVYTNTLLIPKGTPVGFAYKYGMDILSQNAGPGDDEANFGVNRYRVVRSTALAPYTMPMDTFGDQYQEPLFTAGNAGGGQLTIGAVSGGNVPVSWLGRPGAHLQTATDLTSGVWQDVLATDGTSWSAGHPSTNGLVSVTNWPAASTTFFRLVKP